VTTVTAVVSLRYFWIGCELDLGIFCDKCPELTFTEEAEHELRCNGFFDTETEDNPALPGSPQMVAPNAA